MVCAVLHHQVGTTSLLGDMVVPMVFAFFFFFFWSLPFEWDQEILLSQKFLSVSGPPDSVENPMEAMAPPLPRKTADSVPQCGLHCQQVRRALQSQALDPGLRNPASPPS